MLYVDPVLQIKRLLDVLTILFTDEAGFVLPTEPSSNKPVKRSNHHCDFVLILSKNFLSIYVIDIKSVADEPTDGKVFNFSVCLIGWNGFG